MEISIKTQSLVLLLCAGLMLSGGAILAGYTGWSMLRMSYYFWTTELGAELCSAAILLAGALLCLPACWLATLVRDYISWDALTATLLCLVTSTLLVLSIGLSSLGGLAHAVRDPGALNASMTRALAREPYDAAVRNAFSAMQLELKCCGVSSHADWLQHRRLLPPSCCNRVFNARLVAPTGSISVQQQREQCVTPLYTSGCLQPALNELRSFVTATAALTSAIIVVMAVSMLATVFTFVTAQLRRNEVRRLSEMSQFWSNMYNPPAPLAPPALFVPPKSPYSSTPAAVPTVAQPTNMS